MCLIYISLLLNYSKRKISYFSNEILKLKLIYCEIISSNILDNYILINYLIIDFSRGRQPIKRLCIASIHMCTIKLRETFG
jgi:hypothetical protein